MFRSEIPEPEYVAMQKRYMDWIENHPESSNTERFIALNRLYEKAHYGVTSRDLHRGYEIDYIEQDGRYYRVKNAVRGAFVVGGDGNRSVGDDPTTRYLRTKWKVDSKPMTSRQFMHDRKVHREIALAQTEHTTGSDILGEGEALLEHSGIDTGFGDTPGVITPQFVNMILEQVSARAMFKNFVRIVPMPSMSFYFPLKVSRITDNTNIAATAAPTPEGRAGTEFAISWSKFLVNGWKHLIHAGLTIELIQMLSRFIMIRSEYINDMREAMALLWDFSVAEGLYSMMTTAKWRRYDKSGSAWADSEYVPLSGTSGSELLGAGNAHKFILYQDLTPGSANYGKIYNAADSPNHLKYESSTLRPGSAAGDDLFEFLVALASALKANNSALEYFMAPPIVTEFFFRDSRFADMTIATGNPAFQSENGYLGQISIGGSNQKVDIWEYETAVLGTKQSADTTPRTLYPVFGGAYGRAWNQGVYSPFYMRVDDGMEVKADIGVGGAGVDVIRPNETRVITVGSRGSSFPGDFHHMALGLISLGFAHP